MAKPALKQWAEVKALPFEKPKLQKHQRLEIVPLDAIKPQAVWSEGKLEALRKRAKEGGKVGAVRLMKDDDGNWVVVDGIHRTALARETGMTHIAAIVDK